MSSVQSDFPALETLSDEELQELNRERGNLLRPKWAITVAVILLVHSPFLYRIAVRLWERPHYQFFPLILVAFAWLVSLRLPLIEWPEESAFSVRHGLYLLASVTLFAVSAHAGSEWLGLIACLATLWTSVWFFGGSSAAHELRGPFCLLALLIPLPVNLDLPLIVSLQKVASQIASVALEWRSIWHTVSGVLIQTSDKVYLVEEACSGVHSLFSALAAMLCFSIYFRYGAIRSLLVLAATCVWVVLANGLRVFLLVYCEINFDMPLDFGWRHEALGIGTYAVAILMSLSADQLLRFIMPADSESAGVLAEEFFERVQAPVFAITSRLFDEPRVGGRLAMLLPSVLFAVVVVGFGGIAVGRTLMSPTLSEPGSETQLTGNLQERLTEESLPETINGWKRTDFQSLQREPNDIFGGHSSKWFYSGYGLDAVVSLDGYYPSRHDLSVCYSAIGWTVEDTHSPQPEPSPEEPETTPIPHEQLKLFRGQGQHGFVLFSSFDSRFNPLTPPPPEFSGSILKELKDRLLFDPDLPQTGPTIVPPVFQVQLFLTSDRKLMPHEEQALVDLFTHLRGDLLTSLGTDN